VNGSNIVVTPLLGNVGGVAIAPGVPNSAIDAAVAAHRLFDAGFQAGELSCASPLAKRSRPLSSRFDVLAAANGIFWQDLTANTSFP